MTRDRVRAISLAAIMMVSMVAVGVGGLAGSAIADSTELTVNDDGSGDYETIQAAVDEAESGDTITVKSGTYRETVRVKKTVNVEGQGSPVIEAPESVTDVSIPERGDDLSPVVYVNNSDADVSGITINGRNESFSGTEIGLLYRNGDGTISENNVTNFMSTGQTIGVAVYGDSSATVANNSIKRYSRLGIGVLGDTGPREDPDVTIENNTVTNVPKSGWAPNGIQIAWGATGKIHNNNVSANVLLDDDDWSSTGILLAATDNVIIEGNSVYDNQIGVGLIGDVFYGSNVNVSGTTIEGNEVYNNDKGVTVGSNTTGTDIVDNRVYDNGVGVGIRQSGDYGVIPADTDVDGNTFQSNDIQVRDVAENTDVASTVESNSFDNAVVLNRTSKSTSNIVWSLIQDGVDNAKASDTVSVESGTYSESITVDTPNVTVTGKGDSVINGRIDIKSDEVTVEDLTVRNGAPSDSNELEAIFVGNSSGFNDRDGKVTIQNVTVENIHPQGTSKTVEGIHVKHYDSGENIDGVEIANVTVQNVTGPSEAFPAKGANGVKLQAAIRNITIKGSTIDDIEGNYAFGVTSTWSSGEPGSPTDVSVSRTKISNVTPGIGFHVAADGEDDNAGRFADPTGITVEQNEFVDNTFDVYNGNTSETLQAPLNYYGEDSDPLVGGNVIYDPLLTTSIDQLNTEERSEIRDYGSYIKLNSSGDAVAVGFSAAPDGNASEIFSDLNVEGNAFTYDNDDGYVQVEPDDTFSAGDVVVITNNGIDEGVVVPIDTSVEGEAAQPTSVEVENGWNLVATGATNDVTGVTAALGGTGSIADSAVLQTQVEQPGAPPARFGAYGGTWIFVDGSGEISTGYAEDQSPAEYYTELLLTDRAIVEDGDDEDIGGDGDS